MRKTLLLALLAMGTLSMSAQTSAKKYVTFPKAAENAAVVKNGYGVSNKQQIAKLNLNRVGRADEEETGQPANLINVFNMQYGSLTCFLTEIKGGEVIAEGTLVPEVLTKRFAGNTLQGLAMGIPAQIKDITYFAVDTDGNILAQNKMTLEEAIAAGDGQPITLSDGSTVGYVVELPFDEPVQIDGKPFFMGFQYTTDIKKAFTYQGKKACISFAVSPCYFSNSHLESSDFTRGWEQDGSSNGALYVFGVTDGDNGLRANDMALVNCTNTRIVGGDDADFGVAYINLGTNDLNEFDLSYNRGDGTTDTFEDDAEGLPYAMIYYTYPYDEEVPAGRYHPTFTVSKVNGVADEFADGNDNVIESRIIAMSEAQQMTAYIEEGTGTWCGWCPRGFIGMEYVEQNYENIIVTQMHFGDNFTVGATFDGQGNITDLDENDYGYVAYVAYSNAGFPCAWINRGQFTDPYFGSYADENGIPYEFGIQYDVEDQLAIPSEVALGTSSTLNGNKIEVNTSAKFFINAAAGDYAIGYALTEDGLKDAQTNGYSGANAAAYTQTFGSEPSAEISALFQQRSPYACTYNGVARKIYGIEGLEGSVGALAGGGEVVNFNTTLDVPANVSDINNCSLITLVYDTETGEVVQAMKQKIGEGDFEGINTVIREGNGAAQINAAAGQVNIEGNGVANIYTVDGKLVSSKALNGAAAISLPAGNYVVRVNNGNDITVKKVNL